MTTPQSILVLGAGELGSAILSALAAHPALQHTTLTVLLRPSTLSTNPTQLAALRALVPTQELQFTSADDIVDVKGRVACEISSGDELLLTELIFNGVFNSLSPEQCAGLLSCYVFGEKVRHQKEASPAP